jgi:bifunctional enzyme CysN/CysC
LSALAGNGTRPKLELVPPQVAGVVAGDGDLLRIVTSGSVDDGKSTLIGRMLYDSKSLLDDQLEHIERTSSERGDGYVNLALLTDGLRAEREQGITIDVAYRYFATSRRKFILADTPGHIRYTRNMVTGASTADVSIVLVDARHGVVEQSRRHAFIASLLGVRHLVVCVNKMDLVGYDRRVFDAIAQDFSDFVAKLEISDVTFIPMSALEGDNVVHRSDRMAWYEGPPLLYHLETVHVASDRNLIDSRFPVQWVIRPMTGEHHDYRSYAGKVASGVFRVGDEVAVLPSGETSTIASIDRYGDEVEEAYASMSVAIRLTDDLDVSRGDLLCRTGNRPSVSTGLEATICWMNEAPLEIGRRYIIKHTTRSVRATVEALRYQIDVSTVHRDETATQLSLNDIGRVILRTTSPLMFDEYRRSRETGSFIVIDEQTNETAGAGMIVRAIQQPLPLGEAMMSPNVTWQDGCVTQAQRWESIGQRGAVVWMTGLPASGKSTIASQLEQTLIRGGRRAFMLDGDNLRHGINGDLSFSREDRCENVRRTAHVATILAESGTLTIVSLVSPFVSDRETARCIAESRGIEFIEVFVDTPVDECERRDPKGLYRRARAGEIKNFTGIDGSYEPPNRPSLRLTFGAGPETDPVRLLLDELERRGL